MTINHGNVGVSILGESPCSGQSEGSSSLHTRPIARVSYLSLIELNAFAAALRTTMRTEAFLLDMLESECV